MSKKPDGKVKRNNVFQLRSRQQLEEFENLYLAPFSKKSQGTNKTRNIREPEHNYRTSFQRDRDRIIHSRAFRRLKHKRQVFLTSESDHHRTRLTHTLEVSQLSRTMARVLGLNEDLVEAIALGHDMGHTPFGHLGEKILHKIMSGKCLFEGKDCDNNFGGFKHNYQSLRVVDNLEKKYTFPGLNLTAPVREGILKHTQLKRKEINYPEFRSDGLYFENDCASTIEGQVVAICDEIAQRTHDLEDGIRAGLVELSQVRRLQVIKIIEKKIAVADEVKKNNIQYAGLLIKGVINLFVDDVISRALRNIHNYWNRKGRLDSFDEELVWFSEKINPLQIELNKFIYKEIIHFSRANWSDDLGEQLLFRLFQAYYLYPELLPDYVLNEIKIDANKFLNNMEYKQNAQKQIRNTSLFYRSVCDYIAGMTDAYAVRESVKLSQKNKIDISDLKIEYALGSPVYKSNESESTID